MKTSETLLACAEKVVFALPGGVAIWMFPLLQNWVIYLLWGPVLGVTLGWASSEYRDVASGNSEWRPCVGSGILIGAVHLVSVSGIWVLVSYLKQRPLF